MVSRKVWPGIHRKKLQADQGPVEAGSEADTGRSGADQVPVTSGKPLPGLDGRNAWNRRARTLMAAFLNDLGGAEAASAAERVLCKSAATLAIQLEMIEVRFAEGTNTAADVDMYARGVGHLRRVLVDLGLKRVPRDITPRKKHGMSEALYDLYVAEGKIDPNQQETDDE